MSFFSLLRVFVHQGTCAILVLVYPWYLVIWLYAGMFKEAALVLGPLPRCSRYNSTPHTSVSSIFPWLYIAADAAAVYSEMVPGIIYLVYVPGGALRPKVAFSWMMTNYTRLNTPTYSPSRACWHAGTPFHCLADTGYFLLGASAFPLTLGALGSWHCCLLSQIILPPCWLSCLPHRAHPWMYVPPLGSTFTAVVL